MQSKKLLSFKCEGCDYISSKANVNRHSEKCLELRHTQIKLLEVKNLTLEKENNLLEHNKNKCSEQVIILQNQICDLKKQIKKQDKMIEKLENKTEEKDKLIEKLENKLEEKDKMIERLENRLEEKDKRKDTELTKTRKQYDKLISNISTNQKDMFALLKTEGNKLTQHNSHNNNNSNNNNAIYILNQYAPPVIQSIDNVINLDHELTKCINVLSYWNKEKVVHKRLGDIVIKNYKKDEMEQQNIWCSDINRFTYFIRTVLNEENGDKNESDGSDVKEIWYQDKGGVEVSKYVIKPLLECLDDVLDKWMTNMAAFPNLNIAQVIGTIGDIRNGINTHKLEKQIFKYISSHFSLERIKNKEKPILTITQLENEETSENESNNDNESNNESNNEEDSENEEDNNNEEDSDSENESNNDNESDNESNNESNNEDSDDE